MTQVISAKALMDSRKFCMLMDDLAKTWKKRAASDEDKEYRLAQVIEFVSGAPAPRETIELLSVPNVTLTAEEATTYAAEADKALSAVPDVKARVVRMLKQYVLPALAKGQMRIAIPEQYEGRPLPSSNKTWLECLRTVGIHREEIEWATSGDGLPAGIAPMGGVRYLKLG